jgi:ketosteroid isomerase-like protein
VTSTEIVAAAVDAFTRDDEAAIRELHHPDVVFDWSRSNAPDAGIRNGIEEVLGWAAGLTEVLPDTRWTTHDERETAPGVVVAGVTVEGTGLGSGVPVRAQGGSVFELRDGRVARVTLFQSYDDALEAAEQR